MKELKIDIDGRTIFHAEVLEVHWQENDEQVAVTGRFTKAPTLEDMLMAEAAKRQQVHPQEDLPANVSRIPDNRE